MNAGWIVLIVFGSLILLFVLLLLTNLKFRVVYNPEGSRFRASWLFIRKELSIDDATKLFRSDKKKEPDEKEKEEGTEKKETTPEEKEKKVPLSWQIDRILRFLSRIFDRLPGTLTLRARRIVVTVSTGDAAKTALLYGAVSASLAGLVEFVDRSVARVKCRGRDVIDVRADFLSGKTTADIDLTFSARVSRALKLLFVVLTSKPSGGKPKHKGSKKKRKQNNKT